MTKTQVVKRLSAAGLFSLATLSATGWADDGKISLEPLEQTAKIFEYPDISLNHIDYRALTIEYGVGGEASISQLKKVVSNLMCNGSNKVVEQLEVNYQGPKILVRVTDMTHNAVKFLGPLPNDGKTLLGAASCESTATFASLSADFAAKKTEFLKNITQKNTSEAAAKVEEFARNNAVVKVQPLSVTSYQVKSNGTDFTAVNEAYDIATKAYAMMESKDVVIEPAEGIKGAIELWENAFGNPKLNARSDAKILKAAIAYNLSSAYLISMNYMQASAYHKLAMMLNNESGNTLKLPDHQAVIDRQLRNRSLNNTVPNNLVALITLERAGGEYLKHMEVTPLSNAAFSELEQQASQFKTASAD